MVLSFLTTVKCKVPKTELRFKRKDGGGGVVELTSSPCYYVGTWYIIRGACNMRDRYYA